MSIPITDSVNLEHLISEITILFNTNQNYHDKRIKSCNDKFSKYNFSEKEKQLLELNASNSEINNKYSSIVKDFNREKLDIEPEYKAKLQKGESEYRLLSEKLDSLKGYYESKIADVQTQHKSEIIDIEEKILKSLNRKDEIIKKIQEESQYKDITILKYEEMLAKQRKEFLIGANK